MELLYSSFPRRPQLAVFIDGENISSSCAKFLLQKLHQTGEVMIVRIFGNFNSPHLQGWLSVSDYAIRPEHCPNVSGYKNAADIAMTVCVMDVLNQRKADIFCLVSNDSDFTPLAQHIREKGFIVHGYGTGKTSASLKKTCHLFMDLQETKAPDDEIVTPSQEELITVMDTLIKQYADENGVLSLGRLGQLLRTNIPSFKDSVWDSKKLSSLLKDLGFLVEIGTIKNSEHTVVRSRGVENKSAIHEE